MPRPCAPLRGAHGRRPKADSVGHGALMEGPFPPGGETGDERPLQRSWRGRSWSSPLLWGTPALGAGLCPYAERRAPLDEKRLLPPSGRQLSCRGKPRGQGRWSSEEARRRDTIPGVAWGLRRARRSRAWGLFPPGALRLPWA